TSSTSTERTYWPRIRLRACASSRASPVSQTQPPPPASEPERASSTRPPVSSPSSTAELRLAESSIGWIFVRVAPIGFQSGPPKATRGKDPLSQRALVLLPWPHSSCGCAAPIAQQSRPPMQEATATQNARATKNGDAPKDASPSDVRIQRPSRRAITR